MLLADIMDVLRPKVMSNVAFIFGSSNDGKLRRASVGSNCETSKYLKFWILKEYK